MEPQQGFDQMEHVAIVVNDIEQAVRWYQTSFICELIWQEKQQALLQFANIRLQLVLPSLQQPHLAFTRTDAATLGELREQAGGLHSTFIADPTGNIIEIAAPGQPVQVCSENLE